LLFRECCRCFFTYIFTSSAKKLTDSRKTHFKKSIGLKKELPTRSKETLVLLHYETVELKSKPNSAYNAVKNILYVLKYPDRRFAWMINRLEWCIPYYIWASGSWRNVVYYRTCIYLYIYIYVYIDTIFLTLLTVNNRVELKTASDRNWALRQI